MNKKRGNIGHPEELKLKVIEAYKGGMKTGDISIKFGISPSCTYKWLENLLNKRRSNVRNSNRPGKSYTEYKFDKQDVINLLEQYPRATCTMLIDKLMPGANEKNFYAALYRKGIRLVDLRRQKGIAKNTREWDVIDTHKDAAEAFEVLKTQHGVDNPITILDDQLVLDMSELRDLGARTKLPIEPTSQGLDIYKDVAALQWLLVDRLIRVVESLSNDLANQNDAYIGSVKCNLVNEVIKKVSEISAKGVRV